jgi:hypothetical protein
VLPRKSEAMDRKILQDQRTEVFLIQKLIQWLIYELKTTFITVCDTSII